MAIDYTIEFTRDKHPEIDVVLLLLENYLHGTGEITRDQETLFANLPGTPAPTIQVPGQSYPEKTIPPAREKRWFEVFVQMNFKDWDENYHFVSVITRQQDEFVQNVASGFGRLLARRLEGKYIDP